LVVVASDLPALARE